MSLSFASRAISELTPGETAWYKNRENHLVDLHDNVVGTCLPAPNVGSFACAEKDIDPVLDLSKADMKSFFRCTASVPMPFV